MQTLAPKKSAARPPVRIQRCPQCDATGGFLTDSPTTVTLDYYGCDCCGIVWVLDRIDPMKRPRVVARV